MLTRSRMIGWFSLMTSLLNFLSETPAQKQNASSPGYLSFGMAGKLRSLRIQLTTFSANFSQCSQSLWYDIILP